MINDLELEMVVDMQGILTPVFTESDKEKIDTNVAFIERLLIQHLFERFTTLNYQSCQLASIEVARRLNATEEDLELFIKKYQNEQ